MARKERNIVILFMLGFALLGLWQHLFFSCSVGEFASFKNAYDEDTYLLFPFGVSGFRLDRSLSGAIATALLWLSRGSYNVTLAAMDTLLPPLAFLAAYFLGVPLFRSAWSRILFALVMVLATDLFSLGSVASYPGPFPTLAQFAALVGPALVPPMETAYLGLFRSPEPQVSSIISLVFMGLLLRTATRDDDRIAPSELAMLVVTQLLLMMCYSLVSYPVLLTEAGVAALLFLSGRRRKGIALFAMFVGFALIAVVTTRLTLGGSASTMLFASRLPIITVGVLAALLLTSLILVLLVRIPRNPLLLTALVFAGMPLALTNQQLVTGVMASAREWERYINWPFIVVACGLLCAHAQWRISWHRTFAAAAIAGVAVFAGISSIRTYGLFLPDNLISLAIARAVEAARPQLQAGTTFVLDQPGYASLANFRLRNRADFVLNYLETFKAPIAPTQDFMGGPLSRSLFEFWRQTGVTPDQARDVIAQEAAVRNGFYSGFLFNVCEFWYPCTDGRAVKTEKIAAQIPQVVASYEAFLAQTPSTGRFALVSLNPPQNRSGKTEIGEGRAGNWRAVVYKAK